jgi:hypothetical protein
MASSQTSDLRINAIESSTEGAPVLLNGARMATAGIAVTVASAIIPGTLSATFSGPGTQLTNVSTATTGISFAFNFLSI